MNRVRSWRTAAALGLTACASAPPPVRPVPALPRARVVTTLYLIGDAGAPNPREEPVLQALSRQLEADDTRQRVVVYLGDNVYPEGLPALGDPTRPEAERRLKAQIDVVTRAGAMGYFVMGNHDWARYGKGGWEAARRQESFIDSVGRGRVLARPGGGCPGPSVVDLGRRLRLVLLDTQWWLHSAEKPVDPTSACPADAEPEIVDSLRTALRTAQSRLVVLAAHHPLASGGVHGGHFGWMDHLFPLRLVVPWLWLPLPYIGSLYPAARQNGISSQDISSYSYQRMIQAFRRALSPIPPALYAAGHDHNLQVIASGRGGLELVSGAGIYRHSGRVARVKGTLFARDASGFARLDIPDAGPARLAILQVDDHGTAQEVFSTLVE